MHIHVPTTPLPYCMSWIQYIIQKQDPMLKSRHQVKVYAAMQQQTYQTLDKESI